MNSPPHGFGFKLLMHLLAGSWFAATSLVWICIFVPWQDQLPKGRAIDIPWIVLRATWRCATELVQGEYSAYLPLVLISSIFGSLFLARVLYVHRLHSNLVALVFGGLVSIPVFALLLIWLAARGESQRPYPEVRGFLFLIIYGMMIWFWILPALMITFAASGWLLYRVKLVIESIWLKLRPART